MHDPDIFVDPTTTTPDIDHTLELVRTNILAIECGRRICDLIPSKDMVLRVVIHLFGSILSTCDDARAEKAIKYAQDLRVWVIKHQPPDRRPAQPGQSLFLQLPAKG